MNDTMKDINEKELSRRYFFRLIGHVSIGTSIVGSTVITYKFLNPNILFEPSTKFKIEKVDNFAEDSIIFIEARKLFIINKKGGFQAMSAVCTHLGCTVKIALGNQFHCPCHGSKFDEHGDVVAGPAPRPLRHYELSISRDRYLVVDMKKEVDDKFRLVV